MKILIVFLFMFHRVSFAMTEAEFFRLSGPGKAVIIDSWSTRLTDDEFLILCHSLERQASNDFHLRALLKLATQDRLYRRLSAQTLKAIEKMSTDGSLVVIKIAAQLVIDRHEKDPEKTINNPSNSERIYFYERMTQDQKSELTREWMNLAKKRDVISSVYAQIWVGTRGLSIPQELLDTENSAFLVYDILTAALSSKAKPSIFISTTEPSMLSENGIAFMTLFQRFDFFKDSRLSLTRLTKVVKGFTSEQIISSLQQLKKWQKTEDFRRLFLTWVSHIKNPSNREKWFTDIESAGLKADIDNFPNPPTDVSIELANMSDISSTDFIENMNEWLHYYHSRDTKLSAAGKNQLNKHLELIFNWLVDTQEPNLALAIFLMSEHPMELATILAGLLSLEAMTVADQSRFAHIARNIPLPDESSYEVLIKPLSQCLRSNFEPSRYQALDFASRLPLNTISSLDADHVKSAILQTPSLSEKLRKFYAKKLKLDIETKPDVPKEIPVRLTQAYRGLFAGGVKVATQVRSIDNLQIFVNEYTSDTIQKILSVIDRLNESDEISRSERQHLDRFRGTFQQALCEHTMQSK